MEGKVLLVLGASADMGIELITSTHQKYSYILAHYNKTDKELKSLKEQLGDKLRLFQADFLNIEDTNSLIDKINQEGIIPTHIVHLPADKYFVEKFKKTNWESFQTGIDLSLRSLVLILKSFVPTMEKNKNGKIVVLLSSYLNNNAPKYLSSYGTVKYAMLGLIKGLASEYADKGICFNAVSPSMVETKFLSEVSDIIVKQNALNNPKGRNLFVSEVIPTIDFLLSEQSDYITGQNIFITGGQ